MVPKKLLLQDNGPSTWRNPLARVAYAFCLCFALSLLAFYILISICSNTAPALSSVGPTTFLSWFSNGVGPQWKTHVDGSGNNNAIDAQVNYGDAEAEPIGGVEKGGTFEVGNETGTDEVSEGTHLDGIGSIHEGEGDPGNVAAEVEGEVEKDGAVEVRDGSKEAPALESAKKDEVLGGRNETLWRIVGSVPDGGKEYGLKANGSDEKMRSFKECDIFDGRWVRDNRKPFYPPGSCPFVDVDFNCLNNGRPNDDFLNWRWQPNRCDIPRMNATDFLERLRGQRLVFVGDSLNRNMWESLVCTLHESITNKRRVFEISGRAWFKAEGHFSIIFKDYNCSLEFVRVPFLVKELAVKTSTGAVTPRIRLDILEDSAFEYQKADIIVFNTGHWWKHEKTGKNYFQVRDYVYPYLSLMEAYEKGLRTWSRWIDRNINSDKTQVFFRGFSITHFRGGDWDSGGKCHNETEPTYNKTFLKGYPPLMLVVEKTLKKMKTPVTYLNVSQLTDSRKDGHPSIYRMKYNRLEEQIASIKSQDCSHWCLPGVPDAWNQLFYASLLKVGRGPWRN